MHKKEIAFKIRKFFMKNTIFDGEIILCNRCNANYTSKQNPKNKYGHKKETIENFNVSHINMQKKKLSTTDVSSCKTTFFCLNLKNNKTYENCASLRQFFFFFALLWNISIRTFKNFDAF